MVFKKTGKGGKPTSGSSGGHRSSKDYVRIRTPKKSTINVRFNGST